MGPVPPRGLSPAPDRGATRAFARRLRALAGTLSLASMLGAGLLGAVVTPRVGPYLVMGAAIYTGNTEPVPPDAPFPWAALLPGLALTALGAVRIRREQAGGWLLAHLGATLVALAPFGHLLLLWRALPA